MCGIAGILVRDERRPDLGVLIRRMTAELTHRGPDEAGYHVEPHVALGHRRLSIIDVKTGQQPLFNEDRSVCVVFNGEIYNFAAVRQELIVAGHVFRTNSDTEVIVHAYEQWGEDCVKRLDGMFAFAIRDVRQDRLFLARDRFGKKPLFYANRAGAFVFASEMKAILADSAFDRSIDEEALAAYFMFSYIPAPLSIFRHIRKLPPGHVLVADRRGICVKQYWDLEFKPDRGRSADDFIEEFKARMADAVKARLISEVPLGAFLSGGIDSSAVVAFMSIASPEPVNTFSIGFAGASGFFEDERKYARLVAERYRTKHREYEVRAEVSAIIESLVRSFDEPFADDSAIPSYFVCQMARQNVTVALSGLGGDEAFCGYERYVGSRLSQAFARLPRFVRSGLIRPLIGRLPDGYRVNHVKRFVRSSGSDEARTYLGFVLKTSRIYQDRLFADRNGYRHAADAAEEGFLRHYREAKAEDPLDKVFYCDVKTYLPDDILALTDRVSMCHSLEVRVPFLDHHLFEFSAAIPAELKMKGFAKKHLLKKALAGLLPAEVLAHKKQGFVGPLPHWLRGELKGYALDLLSARNLDRHGLFEPRTVGQILSDHFEGRENNDTVIWALMMFQTWYGMYVDSHAAIAQPA